MQAIVNGTPEAFTADTRQKSYQHGDALRASDSTATLTTYTVPMMHDGHNTCLPIIARAAWSAGQQSDVWRRLALVRS